MISRRSRNRPPPLGDGSFGTLSGTADVVRFVGHPAREWFVVGEDTTAEGDVGNLCKASCLRVKGNR